MPFKLKHVFKAPAKVVREINRGLSHIPVVGPVIVPVASAVAVVASAGALAPVIATATGMSMTAATVVACATSSAIVTGCNGGGDSDIVKSAVTGGITSGVGSVLKEASVVAEVATKAVSGAVIAEINDSNPIRGAITGAIAPIIGEISKPIESPIETNVITSVVKSCINKTDVTTDVISTMLTDTIVGEISPKTGYAAGDKQSEKKGYVSSVDGSICTSEDILYATSAENTDKAFPILAPIHGLSIATKKVRNECELKNLSHLEGEEPYEKPIVIEIVEALTDEYARIRSGN